MNTNGNENSLKAKIEQTRQAREAFLRGTTSTPTVNNNNNHPQNTTTNTTTNNNNANMNGITSSSQLTNQSQMLRTTVSQSNNNNNGTTNPIHHFQAPDQQQILTKSTLNQNREIVADKASLIASLNNTTTPTATTNGHHNTNGGNFYQNVQLFKQQQQTKPPLSTNSANSMLPPVAAANSKSSSKVRNLDGYVGFANLPNQVYRKSVKKGFEFNLMVIGESGLGKSTFINSLFLTELYDPAEFPGTFERRRKTACVEASTVCLSEKGVNLKLTVVDTPGFGESIDNSNCWQPITEYIDNKYEEYLNAESKVNRKLPIGDQRIHCCLYFISPGHTLKQLDIEVMKRLHDKVNLIPIIAKADTMTPDEIKSFKATVLNVISEQKLQIYEFPDIDDDDAENNQTNNMLKAKLPFAIVGSNTTIDLDGKSCRARQYPWGCVNIDDLAHCDFMALRTMLIRTHMQDLKDVTNNVHYENYRFKKLAHVTGDKAKPNNKNPFQQLEEERREAELRLEKMKNEMEGVFDLKVREKISRLKESELNLEKQQDAMRSSLEKEEKDLEEKRLQFLREKQLWEESNREDEEKLKHSLDKEADKKKKKIF